MTHSLAKLFKALSEETRLQILALLRDYELSGQEIMAILGMSQSRVSRHLGTLQKVALVEARRDGSWVYYRAPLQPANSVAKRAYDAVAVELESLLDGEVYSRLEAVLLSRRAQVSRFFDERAGQWDRLRGRQTDELSVLKSLAPLLPPELRVADLGTGTGALLPYLARHASVVFGIDSSPAMLSAARERLCHVVRGRDVSLIRAELEALPLPSFYLDGAICHMVLHYLPHPLEALSEMARVLRKRGFLTIIDLATHENEEFRENLAHQRLGFSEGDIEHWFQKIGMLLVSYECGPVQLGDHRLTMFWARGRKIY